MVANLNFLNPFILYISRGANIHGAPYDFRKAANEHNDYFEKVRYFLNCIIHRFWYSV